jgi:hypothetical protein
MTISADITGCRAKKRPLKNVCSLTTIIEGLSNSYLTVILSITNYIITFFFLRCSTVTHDGSPPRRHTPRDPGPLAAAGPKDGPDCPESFLSGQLERIPFALCCLINRFPRRRRRLNNLNLCNYLRGERSRRRRSIRRDCLSFCKKKLMKTFPVF